MNYESFGVMSQHVSVLLNTNSELMSCARVSCATSSLTEGINSFFLCAFDHFDARSMAAAEVYSPSPRLRLSVADRTRRARGRRDRRWRWLLVQCRCRVRERSWRVRRLASFACLRRLFVRLPGPPNCASPAATAFARSEGEFLRLFGSDLQRDCLERVRLHDRSSAYRCSDRWRAP